MAEGAVWILLLLVIIGLWIWAGVKLYQHGGSQGLQFFFKHLGICILLGVISFFIIVFPVLNCNDGWLCGIVEFLIFIGINTLSTLIWPIVLLVVSPRKFQNKEELQNEIIDDI